MYYYPSQTIPNGYLLCDGSEVLIADYPLLFAAIGYIGGDDVATGYFRVPIMQGVVPAGYNPDLPASNPLHGNFGDQVGSPTHTLTIAEMPSHNHDAVSTSGTQDTSVALYPFNMTQSRYDLVDKSVIRPTGGNQAHSIVQPTKLFNWIIKAKNVTVLGGEVSNDYNINGDLTVSGNIINNSKVGIETITNSNGTAIKFSDGTMICTKHISGTVSVNIPWGILYESVPVSLGDYAQPFIKTPQVFISNAAEVGTSMNGLIIEWIQYKSNTYFGETILVRPNESVDSKYNLDLTAIGQWK